MVSLYWLLSQGYGGALSACLGGLCCFLPNFYFARQFFRRVTARFAKEIIKAFYWGEVMKFILTGLMVAAILTWIAVRPVPFITGFIGAQLGVWLVPWVKRSKTAT